MAMTVSPAARYWVIALSSEKAQFTVPFWEGEATPAPVITKVFVRSWRAVARAGETDAPEEGVELM